MKKQIELLHDMQHPFTFLNDHEKYDGSTWLVKIYIFGLALVKQRDKRKWRIVRFSKVKAILTPIIRPLDMEGFFINDKNELTIKVK